MGVSYQVARIGRFSIESISTVLQNIKNDTLQAVSLEPPTRFTYHIYGIGDSVLMDTEINSLFVEIGIQHNN